MGDTLIGTAQVERRGLYYHIQVRCELAGGVMHKVLMCCDGREENLGILFPVDGKFGLSTRIPVKRIGEGKIIFRILPRHGSLSGRFVPLSPQEPFQYITRLKDSFLERRGNTTGIVINKPGRG